MEIFFTLFTTVIDFLANKALEILNSTTRNKSIKNSDKAIVKEIEDSLDDRFSRAVSDFFSSQHLVAKSYFDAGFDLTESDQKFLLKEFYDRYPDLLPLSYTLNPVILHAANLLFENLVKHLDFEHKVLLIESNKNKQDILLSQLTCWEKQKDLFREVLLRLPDDPRTKSIRSKALQRHSLLFNNSWIEMVEPNAEFEMLKDFIVCPSNLCWWAITGQGGSGKSRLAWEIIPFAEKEGFLAFYPFSATNDQLYEVIFQTNKLLFIFDSVAENIEITASFISKLIPFVNSDRIVRILFIDRVGTNSDDAPWLDLLIKKCSDAYYFLRQQCFNPQSGFLVLRHMNDEQLEQVIKNYVSSKNTDIEKQTLLHLVNKLKEDHNVSTNDKCLPLYALIIADCWIYNKKTTWSLERCLEDIFNREEQRLRALIVILQPNILVDEVLRLLCISTVLSELCFSEEQSSIFEDEIHLFRLSLSSEYCIPTFFREIGIRSFGNSDHFFTITGINPDIIGENFVFRYCLADKKNADKREKFLRTIWKDPLHAAGFLINIFQDFPEELHEGKPLIDYLLHSNDFCFRDNIRRKYYCLLLLQFAQMNTMMAQVCEARLGEIYNQFKENDVAWRYAYILLNNNSNEKDARNFQVIVDSIAEIYNTNQTRECYKSYFKALEKLRDLQFDLDQILTIEKINRIKNDFPFR